MACESIRLMNFENEGRYRALFDNMAEGAALNQLVYKDGKPCDYEILDVNPCYERLMSLTREEAIGRKASELYRTGAAPFLAECVQAVETAGPVHLETYFAPADKYVAVSVAATGENQFAVLYLDITGRKLAEQEKTRIEAQFRHAQKMESIGRLAGGITHDFNNLLTVINGYSAMILQDLPQENSLRGYIAEILGAGTRAAALTAQLLSFSRSRMPERKPVNLNLLLEDLKRMLGRLVGDRIELGVSPNAAHAWVLADTSQITQVLMNLAINARDAMEQGGKLLFQTDDARMDGAAPGQPGSAAGRMVVLTISDNGAGMDEATRRRIFEPFFTTKPEGAGTGLGLATVYGIVSQSEGRIEVSSEVGAGTTFRIYLPGIVDAAAETEAGSTPAATGKPAIRPHTHSNETHSAATILLADDDESVRGFLKRVLKTQGYEVVEAANGKAAMERLREHPAQLLITDLVMPEQEGIETMKKVRGLHPTMKISAMSGAFGGTCLEAARLLGADAVLAKPVDPGQLAQMVRELLGH